MISVETTNPVYSNADGQPKSKKVRAGSKNDFRPDAMTNRERRVQGRKAKRNAPKLKRIRRKNGKNAFVMRLIKLVPVQKKQRFSGVDSTLTAVIPASTEYTKTFPDGTSLVIPATDVIVHTAGVFDKSDIAKAFGVTKETLTPEMIDKYLVYIAPAPANSDTATETTKSVVTTEDGTFLASDTQGKDEPTKDVAEEQKQEQKPLKKYEKAILYGGIAVVVIIAGVIIYRKMSKGASQGK